MKRQNIEYIDTKTMPCPTRVEVAVPFVDDAVQDLRKAGYIITDVGDSDPFEHLDPAQIFDALDKAGVKLEVTHHKITKNTYVRISKGNAGFLFGTKVEEFE